jgi:hypothetical protein
MSKIFYRAILATILVISVAFLAVSVSKTFKNSADNVDSILDKTSLRYYSLSFYKSDIQNVYSQKGFDGEITEKREFESEYVSPSKLTIKIKSEKDTKILISKDNQTDLFVNGEKKDEYDDIYLGLFSLNFGKGRFFEIERSLIKKERVRGVFSIFDDIKNLQLIGEEEIQGIQCYKIQGQIKIDELAKETYWIDKESFLIRQFEYFSPARKIPGGYYKTVETYTDIEAR